MKFILTGRAPHLGEANKSIEMTASQAIYERLRGYMVPQASHVDLPASNIDIADQVDLAATPAVKAAKRRRKLS